MAEKPKRKYLITNKLNKWHHNQKNEWRKPGQEQENQLKKLVCRILSNVPNVKLQSFRTERVLAVAFIVTLKQKEDRRLQTLKKRKQDRGINEEKR